MTPADAAAIIRRYSDTHPRGCELFAEEVLGHSIWEMPRQIMRAISRPRAQVAVASCHASGKTFSAAEITLWFAFQGFQVITTAPSQTQVEKVMWGEIRAMYENARIPLGGQMNLTELKLGPKNGAVGLSTNEGVRFQGYHGKILFILDEAAGVPDYIWDAIRGVRAGGDIRILALGNPLTASGEFYAAFTTKKKLWKTFHINALDTPNLEGVDLNDLVRRDIEDPYLDDNVTPYLATRRWVWEMYWEYGPDSPLWAGRVLGRFPEQGETSLIKNAWIYAAKDADLPDEGLYFAGLDVAGPGDAKTVLTIMRGRKVIEQHKWGDPEPTAMILAELERFRAAGITVNVDTVGIGYYMAVNLSKAGFNVNFVNAQAAAMTKADPKKAGQTLGFAKLKDELYWQLRRAFQESNIDISELYKSRGGVWFDPDKDLLGQQLGAIRYKTDPQGRIVVETKDDLKERTGLDSPDELESLMLANARLIPMVGTGSTQVFSARGGFNREEPLPGRAERVRIPGKPGARGIVGVRLV